MVRESVGHLIVHRGPDSSGPDSNKRVTDAVTSLVNDAGGVEIVVEALVYRSELELPLVTQQVDKV